jgi:hypothetical protein
MIALVVYRSKCAVLDVYLPVDQVVQPGSVAELSQRQFVHELLLGSICIVYCFEHYHQFVSR